jgi:hypothetical protein
MLLSLHGTARRGVPLSVGNVSAGGTIAAPILGDMWMRRALVAEHAAELAPDRRRLRTGPSRPAETPGIRDARIRRDHRFGRLACWCPSSLATVVEKPTLSSCPKPPLGRRRQVLTGAIARCRLPLISQPVPITTIAAAVSVVVTACRTAPLEQWFVDGSVDGYGDARYALAGHPRGDSATA